MHPAGREVERLVAVVVEIVAGLPEKVFDELHDVDFFRKRIVALLFELPGDKREFPKGEIKMVRVDEFPADSVLRGGRK